MSPKSKENQVDTVLPSRWKKGRLNRILAECSGKKILVIGDVGLDRYTIGSVDRISPEAPVPIVLVQEEKLKLGLAANVADNIQAVGGVALLVGVVGQDRCGDDFKDLLKTSEIQDSYLVEDRSRRTILKERVVSDRQQLVRIDYESSHAIHLETEKNVLRNFRQLLPYVDGVIVEDYAKGLLNERLLKSIFTLCKRAHKMVIVDPNFKTRADHYRGAAVLTPNTREAESLSGVLIRDRESLLKAGSVLLKSTQATYVVITLGKEGMAIFTRGSELVRLIPTFAREVYDVSGAGDTVIAILSLALASGATIEEAAVLGNLAAGVEVGKRGTATVSPDEIRMALSFFFKQSE